MAGPIYGQTSPKQPPREQKPEAKAGQTRATVVIGIHRDGGIELDGKPLTVKELTGELSRLAGLHPNQTVILRGDKDATYKDKEIARVIDACRKANIRNVLFASVIPTRPESPGAANVKGQQPYVNQVVINLRKNGGIEIDHQPLTEQELTEKLSRLAGLHPDQPVILRCDKEASYKEMIRVLDVCKKANIRNVAFANAAIPTPRQ